MTYSKRDQAKSLLDLSEERYPIDSDLPPLMSGFPKYSHENQQLMLAKAQLLMQFHLSEQLDNITSRL